MSSKVDKLLRKATTFEKLALYGDRKSFLQALGQLPNLVVPNDPSAPPGQGGVHRVDLNPPPAPKTNPPAPLPKIVVPGQGGGGQWLDPNQVEDVGAPIDRDPNILMQKQLNAPAVREQERAAPRGGQVQFDPRVKAVQDFINSELVPAGVISPITPDGRWGNETLSALKQWGQKNKLPLTVNQLFEMAQTKAEAAKTVQQLKGGPNLR